MYSRKPYFLKPVLDCLLVIWLIFPVHMLMCFIVLSFLLNREDKILFRQQRAGLNGTPFWIYKFRTLEQGDQPTKMGQILRVLSLDELPQIWNVIKGEMSFVGPRPLFREYNSKYNIEQKKRLKVKPGITGLAQVNGRNNLCWEEKFEYDVQYVYQMSLLMDIKIIAKTIFQWIKFQPVDAVPAKRFDG